MDERSEKFSSLCVSSAIKLLSIPFKLLIDPEIPLLLRFVLAPMIFFAIASVAIFILAVSPVVMLAEHTLPVTNHNHSGTTTYSDDSPSYKGTLDDIGGYDDFGGDGGGE